MTQSIYVTSAESHATKAVVALGILNQLAQRHEKVGVFRPVTREDGDYILDMLLGELHADLDPTVCYGVTNADVEKDRDAAIDTIISRYHALASQCDAVLIVGTEHVDAAYSAGISFNAMLAANLGAPVALVLRGTDRGPEAIIGAAKVALRTCEEQHATVVSIIANRCDPIVLPLVKSALASLPYVTGAIPENLIIAAPTVKSVMEAVKGRLLIGDETLLGRECLDFVVGAMWVEHAIERIHDGSVALLPGDRGGLLFSLVNAHADANFPSLSAIILNGGLLPPEPVMRLIQGLVGQSLPIIQTNLDTYDTANAVSKARGELIHISQRKLETTRALFEVNIDGHALVDAIENAKISVVTPQLFEHNLVDRARSNRKHIILPEGEDERILRAADILLEHDVVDLTILGDENQIRGHAHELGLHLDKAKILSTADPELLEKFAQEYARLRAHKGVTVEQARETVQDVSYFGTMMIHMGMADGMVSGATHTTAHTIKPSFEIIKTKPGTAIVSSVFLMCLANEVLVYGDCAVNPQPTAEQLADIAVSCAATATQFGVDPKIALLSYSTGASGHGADVDKVVEAERILKETHPELLTEGPIQYDAACDPAVGQAKAPGSPVAGRATVFVFPDLDAGNIGYKAVQRTAGAVAVGPVLQGLNKPVNDLSRGALVHDIVNTVIITAIQAQTL